MCGICVCVGGARGGGFGGEASGTRCLEGLRAGGVRSRQPAGVGTPTAASMLPQVSDCAAAAAAVVSVCVFLSVCLSACLSVRGDYVIVGDLMKSVTLLFYKAAEGALEVSGVCVWAGGAGVGWVTLERRGRSLGSWDRSAKQPQTQPHPTHTQCSGWCWAGSGGDCLASPFSERRERRR